MFATPLHGGLVAALVLVGLVSACDDQATPPSSSPAPAPGLAPTPPAVSCDRRIGGLGPVASDSAWRQRSLIAGPLAIYGARSDLPRIPERDLGPLRKAADRPRYSVRPLLVIARRGSTSTLAVVGQARDHAVFAPSLPGEANAGYPLTDGTAALTFTGCREDAPYTVFSAGLIADGPQCVPIEVTVKGRTVPLRRVIAYGTRDCAGYRGFLPSRR